LIDNYFSYMDVAPGMFIYIRVTAVLIVPVLFHRPTFNREYEKFWQRPGETPLMWIGLLFGFLGTAIHFGSSRQRYDSGQTFHSGTALPNPLVGFYREKIVQCLVQANYPKCPPYTLETMMSYLVMEYWRFPNAQFGSWVIVGMIVRTAFRMGYHRDPSRFPNISPFKAEMRRRLWTMIVQLDLMSSAQMGLPST
jgi:hypothetical protein